MLRIESWILIRRLKKYMKIRILVGLLLSLGFVSNSISQGISSQLADGQGYFGLFGQTGLNMNYLRIGADRIQTAKNVVVLPGGSIPRPALRLNPIGGQVTIGGGITDPAGTLTILSPLDNNATRDIHFNNQGNVGSDGSIYMVLDQDNNGDDFFSVKGSDFDDDLFWVGENGHAYLKGDLVVEGKVSSSNIRGKQIATVGFTDFEAYRDYGDELYLGADQAARSSASGLRPRHLAASLKIPHGSRITRIEVVFIDDDPEEAFCIDFYETGLTRYSSSTPGNLLYNRCTTPGYSVSGFQIWSAIVDVPVDAAGNFYWFDCYSGDWSGTLAIRHINVYYE